MTWQRHAAVHALLGWSGVWAVPGVDQIIDAFLMRYCRPVTVVEFVGGDSGYSHLIKPNRWWYTVALGRSDQLVRKAASRSDGHLVVMAPQVLDGDMVDTFARCESPDCVILPAGLLRSSDMVGPLFQLGDFCIVVGEWRGTPPGDVQCCESHLSAEGVVVSIYKTNKKGLDIARWMCRAQPRTGGEKYPIETDFSTKILKKGAISVAWKAGINLMTFLMLRGVYPVHDDIRAQIKKMKRLDHNDLVIGNMILQGRLVVPIDFADARRDGKKRRCIKAALKLLKKYRELLLSDPRRALDEYHFLLVGR